MREIASEPKLENFSPTLKIKNTLSNSETNIKGKDKYCQLENLSRKWSIGSGSEDEHRLSPISEKEEFSYAGAVKTATGPPDGGWGWVVCFACFMGKRNIISNEIRECLILCYN